jgi:hypothetical protein
MSPVGVQTLVCLDIQDVRHAKVYLPLAAPKATRAVNTNLRNQLKRGNFEIASTDYH